MSLFVYLDESGDSGFKFRQGSSRYFVITLFLVNDPIPIQTAIDDLREQLSFGPRTEFKFNHSADDVKERFLRTLRNHDFLIRAIVIDKTLMTQPYMRKRETFYNYLVRLVLTYDHGSIGGATLVLDESIKSKKQQLHIGTYLRRALNSDPGAPKIRKIVHRASHSDNLIQAADMISGAIYRKYDRGDDSYLYIVRKHIADLWEWKPD